MSLQLVEHDRVDHAADAAPRGGDAVGEPALALEVLGEYGYRGDEETPGCQTDADPLREDEVPELGRDTGHHQAERQHDGAEPEEGAEVARIEEGPRDDAE